MSVIKLSKKDITRKDDEDKKIKLKRSQLSYDSAMISGLETENEEAANALSEYITKRTKGDWLSNDDIETYRSALDQYKSSSESLAGIRKAFGSYNEEDEKAKQDYLSSIATDFDEALKVYRRFDTADKYKSAIAASKEREGMKTANLSDIEAEIKKLEQQIADEESKASSIFSWIMSDKQKDKVHGTNIESLKSSLDAKKKYYDSAVAVQDFEKYSLSELNELAENATNNDDRLYYTNLSNQKAHQHNTNLLENTKMDGEDVSVLDAMYELAHIEDSDYKAKRIQAIKNKIEPMGLNFDDTYSLFTGDSNISAGNFVNWLHAAAKSGLASWNKGLSSTADVILGKPLQTLGWKDNPISSIADYYDDQYNNYAYELEEYKNRMGGGEEFDLAGQFVQGTVAAVPDAILALMTSGASTTTKLATTAANSSGNILTKAGVTVQNMAKNPQFWLSFARTYGTDYEEAVEAGASDLAAAFGSTISSLVNAGIEIGLDGASGIQGLTQSVKQGNKKILLEWIQSSLEEGGEEILQGFVSDAISKALYDNNTELFDLKEMATEGAMGVGIGALLGGGQTIASVPSRVAANKYQAKMEQIGSSVDEEAIARLQEIAGTMGKGTRAYNLSQQVDTDSSKKFKGEVVSEVIREVYGNQSVSAVESLLKESGADTNDLSSLASAFLKDSESGRMSNKVSKAIKNNPKLMSVWKKLNDSTENDVAFELQEAGLGKGKAESLAKDMMLSVKTGSVMKSVVDSVAADPKVKSVYDSLVTKNKYLGTTDQFVPNAENKAKATAMWDNMNRRSAVRKSAEEIAKKVIENKFEVSSKGETTNIKTGDQIKISGISSIKNGKMVLKLDNGETINAEDVSFASDDEALLYSTVLHMDVSAGTAESIVKSFNPADGVTASQYALGVTEAYKYGRYNIPVGEMTKKGFSADLTDSQRSAAYQLGQIDARAEVARQQEAIDKIKEKAAERLTANPNENDSSKAKKGRVRFEKDVVPRGKNQKRTVSLAKHLARAIGIDIVFYDARTTTKKDGKDANGYFDEDTDTIYLDLQNAQDDAKTIMFTLSHELTHFIKKWSPDKFNTFANFLMSNYAKHGVDASVLLSRKMTELGTEDADLAYEEMICDACETMLLDSNAVYKLMELRATDLELFEKIKLHIHKILNEIRNVYKSLGLTPTSDEAKALLEMKDVLEQIYSLFEEAAVDATQSYQAVGTLETESVSVSEDGVIKMQMKQYRDTGRSTLLNYLKEQYGDADANDLISTIDNIYNAMADIKKDTALSVFGNWQDTEVELDENGHPIFTTSINNGDYKLNQDFSRVCKKRRQLDFVLNMLAEDPAFEASNLTKDDIVKINQAIKKHGFEIACALCFVDSKRFRQTEWADSFANTWNDILYSVVSDKSKLTPFNFATTNPNLADDGIEIDTSKSVMYRKWSNGKEDVKNRRNHDSFDSMLEKKPNGNFVEGNASVRAIVKILKENPHLRHTFRGADIIGSQGFDTIQRLAPNIRGILDGWGGTSVPKPSSNDAIYDNSVLNIAGYNAKSAFAIGGVRMNSFSDFMAHMFFDYVQAFADLSAKGLPMHSYTKELDFARLFGLAKGKINMSAIAAIRENATDLSQIKKKADKDKATEWEKSIAGLDISKLADKLGKAEADITYDDIIQNLDDCEYVWADESIDVRSATLLQSGIMYDNLSEGKAAYCYELIKEGKFEEAFKVAGEKNVNRDYAKHLGIITVGVSKAHILKLLRDPTIRMVIPYHKSGLNAQVAAALKIAFYEDFTDVQNTMLLKKDGSTVGLSKDGAKIGDKNISDFNFYKYFGKTIDGVFYDGKATASKYIDWCENGEYNESVGEYGYYLTDGSFITKAELDAKGLSILPKFNEFATEENYYKLVEDFDCYDTITGEHSPQEAVDLFHDGLPTDYKDVLIKALKAEQKVSDDFRDHLDNHGLRDEVMEIVKPRGYKPSNIKKQAKRLRAGMSEDERYSVLKDAKIVAITDLKSEAQPAYIEIEKVPEKAKGQVEKLIKDLADDLEILNVPLSTSALDIEFQLSKNNGLRESLSQQLKYGGNFHDFSKALINLRDILNRAVLVEVHTEDKYKGTVREDINFEAGYVLFSAFKSQEYVIPVKLEIKQKKDVHNILYVVVSMTKINRTSVMESAFDGTDAPSIPLSDTDSVYSLPHLASKINPKDKDFLKYLPDQMLSTKQSAAKRLALEEEKKKLDAIPKKLDPIKKQLKKATNRSLLANALEGTVQNEIEKNKLAQYKEKIDLIESEQQKLSELRSQIKEISFSKGKRDTAKLKKLQDEASRTANRINTYDRQLLNLEATTALKNVLNREKEMAKKRQKQKDAENLKAYKEKATRTQMRHKIQGVVSELNQLLLKGTKDKHVMIGLQKAVAEALDAVNMDTVGADERVAKYNALIAQANDPDVIASLTASRDRIQEMGDKMSDKLTSLKNAYNDIKNSDDPLIANSYDEVISSRLEYIAEKVGNTPLRDMTLSQLEDVYDMYKMVLTVIRNSNKAFKNDKNESIATLGNRVMMEVDKLGKKKAYRLKGTEGIEKFRWNNLKPIYAFERIGSGTLTDIFNSVRAGEDTWAEDVTEAREYYLEQSKKHNYDSWDFDKRYKFRSTSGMDFELSLEQIMSLYAYSKREQAKDHLKMGGIVFDESTEVTIKTKLGIPLKFNPTEATAYNLSDETLGDIISKLSEEQKAFVDEMQNYLSTEMGDKGNEVSLEMYGVKLFKEKFYFPLKSATQYMAKAKEQQKGEIKIKNSGFSKETVQKANNPIVLTPFMDVWANHVNEMSMYHAFVLPMEDFYRVFNYKTPTSDTMATESVEMFIQNSYGKGAVDYIDQLLKDLNGGAVSDPRETFSKSLMSNFKKAAVMASMSVVIQQPTALVRAMALVDAKHFGIAPITRGVVRTVNAKKHKELWGEIKKYAPVAIIKEMGRFDTNMGRSVQDFVKSKKYKGLKEKIVGLVKDSGYRDDAISRLPALADEMAWVAIWEAVKRETVSKHKDLRPGSSEFLKVVGDRFTEVVTKTQVYDSVLARSANMRSKTAFMNMWTSFMAEPTTSINMLEDALRKFGRGDKKYAAKTIGAVYGSILLNAALVSLVYAARDDDEDETFAEKYASRLSTEILDGINPITYIPFLKDVWSIMQGFDIERADMSLVTDLIDSLQETTKVLAKDTSDMDEEELKEHQKAVSDALWGIVGDIGSLAGLPAKNVIREINGAFNLVETLGKDIGGRKTTLGSLVDEVLEDVKSSTPIVGWLPGETKNGKLYDAIVSGDTSYVERLKSGYKDDKAYETAVRKALRENDPRIKEAAKLRKSGEVTECFAIVDKIASEGRFTRSQVVSAVNSELEKLKKSEQ